MKSRFESDDDLPFVEILKLHNLTVVIRSVLDEDSKYYLQISLDKCLYQL